MELFGDTQDANINTWVNSTEIDVLYIFTVNTKEKEVKDTTKKLLELKIVNWLNQKPYWWRAEDHQPRSLR